MRAFAEAPLSQFRSRRAACRVVAPLVALAVLLLPAVALSATIDQTLNLKVGWNAVWLEVGPVDAEGQAQKCSAVFDLKSSAYVIDYVAMRNQARVDVGEFVTNPDTTVNDDYWQVYKADDPDSDFAVRANRGYLVFVRPVGTPDTAKCDDADWPSTDPCGQSVADSLSVSGEVEFYQPVWTRGEYNLVGFGVDSDGVGNPNFLSLLKGSGIEIDVSSYPSDPSDFFCQSCSGLLKLGPKGDWVSVDATEPVNSGEAYWILVPYTFKGAGWSGPVETDFPGAISGRWNFGSGPGSLSVIDSGTIVDATWDTRLVTPSELTFSNLEEPGDVASAYSVTLLEVGLDPPDNQAGVADPQLELLPLEPVPAELYWRTVVVTADPWQWSATATEDLAAGQSRTVTLGLDVDRNSWEAQPNYRERLYKIEVSLAGGGKLYRYLPVVAGNSNILEDKTAETVAEFAGLWVGQITLGAVTSLQTVGQPVQATPSLVPMDIYIHVDAAGTPRLLSRGVLMQTKTASDEVEPTPVLVVDETKLPYFEGIRERPDGLREGLRLETVAYDMPRDLTFPNLSPTLQQAVTVKFPPGGSDESIELDKADPVLLGDPQPKPETLDIQGVTVPISIWALTEAAAQNAGFLALEAPSLGDLVFDLEVTFDVLLREQTAAGPGEGFSFNFGPGLADGGFDDWADTDKWAQGVKSGLSVTFDTIKDEVAVVYDGEVKNRVTQSLIQNDASSAAYNTYARVGVLLESATEDPTVTVSWQGTEILTQVPVPYEPEAGWNIAFAASTSDVRFQGHAIGNEIEIRTRFVPGTSVIDYFDLDNQTERPPDLPETYYRSWELGGALGVGRTLITKPSMPLTLDPFHRSNPFRHAYHPQHGAGLPISRTFSIVFDESPDPDILNGTYEETTYGLARQPIESLGLIELRRVSTVKELQ